MRLTPLIAVLILAASQLRAQPITNHSLHFNQSGFIQNDGQFCDEHGKVNEHVKFLFAKSDFHLALKTCSFSYELVSEAPNVQNFPESGITDPEDLEDWQDVQPMKGSVCRVDVTFAGANIHPKIERANNTGTIYNYYRGKNPVLNVPSYNRIIYKDIYAKIDLVFEIHHSEKGDVPEYSFIVHRGGDVSKIKMIYSGAGNVSLEDQHTLSITTPEGFIKETGLRGYSLEDGSPSDITFNIKDNIISFKSLGDKNQTLIIDPFIVWGSYYGGKGSENWDTESEIALDTSNNVYLSGSTTSFKFIATTGAVMQTYGGNRDMFLAKFSLDGTQLLWATYYGGTGMDVAYGVSCDRHNNVLITGFTESPDIITTPGVFQTTRQGKSDVVLAKFTTSGEVVWSTLMGGPDDSIEHEHGRSLICDAYDNIFICGYTLSSSNISTTNAHQKKLRANGDAFLVKFTPEGQKVWGTYKGGGGKDRAHALCLDLFGNVYFVGTTKSKTTLISNGFQTVIGGKVDGFIAKFDTAGNYYWSSYYGGSEDERCRGVECDSTGNVYFCGWTDSPDSNKIATPNSFQTHNIGGQDGFIAKFNSAGGRIWGTYLGGTLADYIYGIALDEHANIYICGSSISTTGIATSGALQPTKAGLRDGILEEFDSSCHRIWGTYMGGTTDDDVYDIERDNNGALYISMDTHGPLPVTTGSYQTITRGQDDLAVFKLDFDTVPGNLKFIKVLAELSDYHLKVYPNPTAGSMTIQLESSHADEVTLIVSDAIGKVVFTQSEYAKEGINIFSLSLSHLTSGKYFLEVKGGDTRYVTKFTIEK